MSTVTNCTFSTRWSVFRFGGGNAENITVSNCVDLRHVRLPIKMQVEEGSRMENMIFSNLVMNNVTGPIYVGLGSVPRNSTQPKETRSGGVVRNLTFKGIRAIVAPAPDLKDFPYTMGTPIDEVYAGEHRTCIDLTAFNGQFIENITLSDIHITFAGGGTAKEAALREVPQVSGAEYFGLGVLPAYGMYARNVRGLALNNVRFDLAAPDLRPALVFDGSEDIALNAFSAVGNSSAESLSCGSSTLVTRYSLHAGSSHRVLHSCKWRERQARELPLRLVTYRGRLRRWSSAGGPARKPLQRECEREQ